ncbi:MAG: hypothetical protein COV59_05065 [Candidatus Magasanikbacteria bacterium CG11_big_fil_rev_8_21_14_0_20_39_34]|uniref:Uncharacterized protein n=1 Tax=Candidatus Magasanikbacteria bacterium CG11_big_fil_rev_8_21_14_0_20_39_34 TaxID=1974653 RepID=A0A2H0N3Q5_9BACT|nr:MAG: hypothetical protein COV59_05065 [Candidatus Magasanikbacteria bacterium CG11_big_fil_rev_8_21_14_0_20_39_34]
MKIEFEGKYRMIPGQLLRRCSYAEFRDPHTQKVSYVKRLRPGMLYPRFHVYIDAFSEGFTLNLHLDQKKESYRGCSMHSGEYDGEQVSLEAKRIQGVILEMKMQTDAS